MALESSKQPPDPNMTSCAMLLRVNVLVKVTIK